MEVAKAIEEEERNIGVAFIPPFTLTCVCVCVSVCYVCTEFEDRVLLISSHAAQTEERYLFFIVLFSAVFRLFQCTQFTFFHNTH